jgi:hypothetical protein
LPPSKGNREAVYHRAAARYPEFRRPRGGRRGRGVPVVAAERSPLDPPHHHVVQDPGGVEARLAGYGRTIALVALFADVP